MIDLLMFANFNKLNALFCQYYLGFFVQSVNLLSLKHPFNSARRLASCLLCLTLTLWLLRAIKQTINKHDCHFVHDSPHLVAQDLCALCLCQVTCHSPGKTICGLIFNNSPFLHHLLTDRWCQSGTICLPNCHRLSTVSVRMITGV